MDNVLFESLLNEGESTTLDFKESQYKFNSTTEEEKSELLKDILAFANAWRHTQAYILIGVAENSTGRAIPLGIEDHIDDAKLQQFVNQKTNQPVNFKYYSFQFESKSIGIIQIDIQARPIYLKKKFANLEANLVYLRRGSSTAIAAPDEISRMGAAAVQQIPQTQLELQFAIIESRSLCGKTIDIKSILFSPRIDETMIRHRSQKNVFGEDNLSLSMRSSLENSDFAVDVFKFVVMSALTTEINFHIKNNGNQPITNLKVAIAIAKTPGLFVLDKTSFPQQPERIIMAIAERDNPNAVSVSEFPQSYEASFVIDRLLPGDGVWTQDGVYLGSQQSTKLNLETRILADQIPQPISEVFTATINTKIVNRTLDEWMVLAFDYE